MLVKFWDEHANFIGSYNASNINAQGIIPNVDDIVWVDGNECRVMKRIFNFKSTLFETDRATVDVYIFRGDKLW